MPLPNVNEFINSNVTHNGFKKAQENLVKFLNYEVATKQKTVIPKNTFTIGSDSNGQPAQSSSIAKSQSYKVAKGQTVRIYRDINKPFYVGISLSTNGENFKAPDFYSEESIELSVGNFNYVKFYISKNNGTSITLNEVIGSSSGFEIQDFNINKLETLSNEIQKVHSKLTITAEEFLYGDNVNGPDLQSSKVCRTKTFNIPKGVKIKINNNSSHPTLWWSYALSADGKNFTRPIWYGERSYQIENIDKNYIRFYLRYESAADISMPVLAVQDFNIEFNLSKYEFDSFNGYTNFSLNIKPEDFEMGSDVNGMHQAIQNTAKSSAYFVPAGSKVKIKYTTTSGNYWYSYAESASPNSFSRTNPPYAESEFEFTVSADKPYLRFYAMHKSYKNFTIQDLVREGLGFEIEAPESFVKSKDLLKLINPSNLDSSLSIMDTNMSYRCPSRSIGGVVTFIDDDGRQGFFNELYPVIVANNIPFGVAISPGLLNTAGYMTLANIMDLNNNPKLIEFQSHTWTHAGLNWTTDEEDIKFQVASTKNWFMQHGIAADSFVYPYGADNAQTQRLVSQYFTASYDFATQDVVNFDTIQNFSIKRAALSIPAQDVTVLKNLIDRAASENAWLIITTHAGNPDDDGAWWSQQCLDAIIELNSYAINKGCKILKPRDAFQIYGNLMENDSGFRITAEGKILNAQV